VAVLSKVPATAPDLIALLVVELCLLLGIDEPWLTDTTSTVEASTDPYVVMRYHAARLRVMLSQGDFSHVASEIHELYEAFLRISLAVRQMEAGMPADIEEKPDATLRDRSAICPPMASRSRFRWRQ